MNSQKGRSKVSLLKVAITNEQLRTMAKIQPSIATPKSTGGKTRYRAVLQYLITLSRRRQADKCSGTLRRTGTSEQIKVGRNKKQFSLWKS